MRKLLLGFIVGLVILSGLNYQFIPKAFADAASLTNAAISQTNIQALFQCTVVNGIPVAGTCTTAGVNWASFMLYQEANVNWQDLPGVTGAPYSSSTWIKSNAP